MPKPRPVPTLKKDRLGGTPNTGTYKRSKASIAAEKQQKLNKKIKKQASKRLMRAPTVRSKKITKVQVGRKKK